MSKGELTTYTRDSFLALAGADGEMQEAMNAIAEVGEEFGPQDLTRVPTPAAGATQWTIPGIAGDEVTESITGVLCWVQKRGILWPSEEPEDGSMPVLVTHDLKTAEQVGPIPDNMIDTLEKHRIDERRFDWENLPYNQFGTGQNGQGKRAKEQRVLFVLREGDMYPLVVPAQPGSLKTVRQFILKLPQEAKVPFWRCVVSLELESLKNRNGQKYSRIVPKLVGMLSAEDGKAVKEKYTDVLSSIATQVSVDDTPDDEGDGEQE